MCGRYSLSLENSKSFFKEGTINKYSKVFSFNNSDVSPSSSNPVIFKNNDEYVFEYFKWGLSYDWLPKGRVLFNIRSETVFDKEFSRDLILKQRCLVPFNSYFEWQNKETTKQKYKLYTPSDVSFFAAIYIKNKLGFEYSILTKPSSPNVEHIHDRNPIIVAGNKIKMWFSNNFKNVLIDESIDLKFMEI